MDDLDEGSWGQRPYQGPRPAARTCRQTGARQAEDRNGRTICRGKGRRRRLHADRSPRSERSRGAIQGGHSSVSETHRNTGTSCTSAQEVCKERYHWGGQDHDAPDRCTPSNSRGTNPRNLCPSVYHWRYCFALKWKTQTTTQVFLMIVKHELRCPLLAHSGHP